ncbi:MAG: hypothetical protein WB014_06070 [Methanosarcina sp.]
MYSFMCPLPAAWAKNAKLDQSSFVEIYMLEDGSLIVSPVPQPGQGSKGIGAPTTTMSGGYQQ